MSSITPASGNASGLPAAMPRRAFLLSAPALACAPIASGNGPRLDLAARLSTLAETAIPFFEDRTYAVVRRSELVALAEAIGSEARS